jgi:nitrilase
MAGDSLTVALAQIAPVWLDRAATLAKVNSYVEQAAQQGCGLVAFGEALVPGYPFWLELTDGARFNSPLQKTIFAEYAAQAVQPESGHLDEIRATAARNRIAVYLGCVERAADRGAHSLYCSLLFIDPEGNIGSIHRKLIPTYEERLVWAAGDGHGLRTHSVGPFQLGGLSCWENWMPLARRHFTHRAKISMLLCGRAGSTTHATLRGSLRWNRDRTLPLFRD